MPIVTNKAESVFVGFIVAILSVLLMCVGMLVAFAAALVNGWVGMYLWKWFVTPLGVAPITFVEAAGLATLFAFWCPTPNIKSCANAGSSSGKAALELIALIVFKPLLTLLFGYFLHRMM